MTNNEEQELESFIDDWYWDEKSHRFAQELGRYLFQFIDTLYEQDFSEKTIRKHTDNCWCIGILECQYNYAGEFSPGNTFDFLEANHEYEFQRKISDSEYAMQSYRSTWRKLHKYTKALGYLDD